jgi:hypothetical protein
LAALPIVPGHDHVCGHDLLRLSRDYREISGLAREAGWDEARPMPLPMRPMVLRSALVPLAAVMLVAGGGCRRWFGGSEQTSLGDIEANLDQLVGVAKTGLDLQVSPRFLTFGPLPSAAPWSSPVPGGQAFEAQGHRVTFKTGRDGMIRERYEARACPLREIWSCVELWATGRFGKNDQIACVGLRLEKGVTIEQRKLDMRQADNCPFLTTGAGPAQQAVRGVEKAYLDHARQQQPEKYLEPKAE